MFPILMWHEMKYYEKWKRKRETIIYKFRKRRIQNVILTMHKISKKMQNLFIQNKESKTKQNLKVK